MTTNWLSVVNPEYFDGHFKQCCLKLIHVMFLKVSMFHECFIPKPCQLATQKYVCKACKKIRHSFIFYNHRLQDSKRKLNIYIVKLPTYYKCLSPNQPFLLCQTWISPLQGEKFILTQNRFISYISVFNLVRTEFCL